MANLEEIGDQQLELKGDAIGNTLYSERWVLKLLMRLHKIISSEEEFSQDLEDDLCSLWDMSAEKDVSLFIKEHGILDLAISTVTNTDSPRLIEIMIGIMGNMCYVESIREECEQREDILKVLLHVLSLPDVPTLIQVMRILQLFAFNIANPKTCVSSTHELNEQSTIERTEEQPSGDVTFNYNNETKLTQNEELETPILDDDLILQANASSQVVSVADGCSTRLDNGLESSKLWCKQFCNVNSWLPQINFILKSVTNTELLELSWLLLETLCYVKVHHTYLICRIADSDLFHSLFESFKEFFQGIMNNEDMDKNISNKYKRSIKVWTSVLYSFTLHEECAYLFGLFKESVMKCSLQILSVFEEFLPMDSDLLNLQNYFISILISTLQQEPMELTSILYSVVQNCASLLDILKGLRKGKQDDDTNLEIEAINCFEEFLRKVLEQISNLPNDENIDKISALKEIISRTIKSE